MLWLLWFCITYNYTLSYQAVLSFWLRLAPLPKGQLGQLGQPQSEFSSDELYSLALYVYATDDYHCIDALCNILKM